MQNFDVVIAGAGAAGLFCAGVAAQRGLRVLLIDHAKRLAEKIRISGGGRCNFTNREVTFANFISQNPRFCRSALSQFTCNDFIDLIKKHQIAFHEKHKGQLFCDKSANDIIEMLLNECENGANGGKVTRWQGVQIKQIRYRDVSSANQGESTASCYEIDTENGSVQSKNLVIATGGLSIPKIGASDLGYRIAKQFGLAIVATQPALVPLNFDSVAWRDYSDLSGLSIPVAIEVGSKKQKVRFLEDLLFTHQGLSGPAILQISTYWQNQMQMNQHNHHQNNNDLLDLKNQHNLNNQNLNQKIPLKIHFQPEINWQNQLIDLKKSASRRLLSNELTQWIPNRLAHVFTQQKSALERPVNEISDKALMELGSLLSNWEVYPTGTQGYQKAEVTLGGVDTRDVSSQTMESKQRGLYFIGEVLDVTGWLGGYNFQWAWSSAYACAQALN